MKRLGTKGFSAVEGLLILVIVGAIGGLGYYVYKNRNPHVKESDSTVTHDTSTAGENPETPAEVRRTLGSLSFVAPKEWQNLTKAELTGDAHGNIIELAAYSFEVNSDTKVTSHGRIGLEKISRMDDYNSGLSYYQEIHFYDKATKTWRASKPKDLSDFNTVVATYDAEGGPEGGTARNNYYYIKDNFIVTVQMSESMADASTPLHNVNPFASSSSKSTAVQDGVISFFDSIQ